MANLRRPVIPPFPHHHPTSFVLPSKRAVVRALTYLAAAAVLGATLFPTGATTTSGPFECVLCGERSLADVLLNIALFLPLGAAVALTGASLPRAALVAGALSATVEVAQLAIPGRDASLGDLLFNIVGASLGVLIVRSAPRWMDPTPTTARALALGAAVATTVVHLAVGWLLTPTLPESEKYFGMWTPRLRQFQPFRGNVIEATLGTMPIVSFDTVNVERVRSGFERGDAIRTRVIVERRATALAPIVAIFDDRRREILLLGADRDALVFRYRTRAATARLDQPDLRARGAARIDHAGDTLRLSVRRESRRVCFDSGLGEQCSMGFTLGQGWGLLLYIEKWPDWLRAFLDVAWLAVLAFPAGFWARSSRIAVAVALVTVATLLAVPPVVGLYPTPVVQMLAALAGVLLGYVTHRRFGAPHAVPRK